MRHGTFIGSGYRLVLGLALLLCVTGSSACNGKTAKAALATGAMRGATVVDIYGTWTLTNDPLGRAPKRWTYRFEFVPTGTTVYTNGTTSGRALQPLDAGVVTWAPASSTVVVPTGTPSATPDANGSAAITLTFGPAGAGSATLTVTIAYGGATGSDTTAFEVDRTAP